MSTLHARDLCQAMKGALEYGLLIYNIYHCILQLATYPLASSSDVGLFARPWQDRKIRVRNTL
jgi:hypothetical protein